MKRLLATTALVAITAMPAAAEQHSEMQSDMPLSVGESETRVSNLMDATVYMPADGTAGDIEGMQISSAPDSWTEIGTISDVFVDGSGEVSTVVLTPNDNAGSDAERLGVMVDAMTFKESENGEQLFVVYTGDKVTLEQSDEFDEARAEDQGMMSASEVQNRETATDVSNDAQSTEQMADAQNAETSQDGITIRASDLSGRTVYIPGEGTSADDLPTAVSQADANWQVIGDVDAVVLTQGVEIKSVTLDAGDFLGIGEKEVEASMDELHFVRDSDTDGEWFVVFTGDRSVLEEREEYDRAAAETRGETYLSNNRTNPVDVASNQSRADELEMGSQDPQLDSEILRDRDANPVLTAEQLDGAPVYDSTGEEIGNVSRLVMADGGAVSEVVIDVGGFLGIGDKPVAISYEDLEVFDDVDTAFGDVRVSVAQTRSELEAMETWTQ